MVAHDNMWQQDTLRHAASTCVETRRGRIGNASGFDAWGPGINSRSGQCNNGAALSKLLCRHCYVADVARRRGNRRR